MPEPTRAPLEASSPSRRPQVAVVLGPKQAIPRRFAPLLPPRSVRVALEGLGDRPIDALKLSAAAELAPGDHDLPLPSGASVRVRVEPGARIQASLAASDSDGRAGPSPTIVSRVDVELSPPLVLEGILPVLLELPLLFEDHSLGAVIERARGHEAGANLLRWLEAARATTGKAAHVALERIEARPRQRRGVWLLELRFTGTFFVGGTVPIRFERVRLPHVLIPAVHAELSKLLSGTPLATASLRPSAVPLDTMVEALLGMLTGATGRFDVQGDLPEAALKVLLHDRSTLLSRARLEGPAQLSGAFEARVSADALGVSLTDLALRAEGERLGAHVEASFTSSPDEGEPSPALAGGLLRAAREGAVPPGFTLTASATLDPGSCVRRVLVSSEVRHDLLVGGASATTVLTAVKLEGSARVRAEGDGALDRAIDVGFSCAAATLEPTSVEDGALRAAVTEGRATLHGRLRGDAQTPLDLSVSGDATAALRGAVMLTPLPELGIDDGEASFALDAAARFELVARVRRTSGPAGLALYEVDGTGTTLAATLERGDLQLGGRTLTLPGGTTTSLTLREARLDVSGLGRADFEVAWDMAGRSPVLSYGERSTELFVESLRKRAFVVSLGTAGGLTVTGDRGDMYNAHFFNALLNPGADVDALLDVLDDEEATDHILAALELFSEDAYRLGGRVRELVRRVKRALDAEGVKGPGDGLPAPVMSRVISRVLCGTAELEPRVLPLVLRVVAGDGLDVVATKHLLEEQLGDHPYAFELDRGLRWAAHMLAPAEPLAPFERLTLPPLELAPEHQAALRGVPSARELYAGAALPGDAGPDFPSRVGRVAPFLSLEQLDYVFARMDAWPREARRRVLHARELKRRVRLIAESYGGVAFFPQAMAISFFLGEMLAMGAAWPRPGEPEAGRVEGDPRHVDAGTLFGPEDVAVLLQASLSSPLRGRTEQLNERMLLDHVFAQPPAFLLGVLVELSGRSSYVLAGTLNAMLNGEQDCLKLPLDLVSELSSRLGVELPRLSDYTAGGRFAKLSYFEALDRAAQQILAASDAYLALKCHLQLCRAPVREAARVVPVDPSAREAIERADAIAHDWRERPDLSRVEYTRAFDACRAHLARDPEAFQEPFLRTFWLRNHEALVVLTVLRNVQGDVDATRHWLRCRTGAELPADEQELLERIVDVLYYDPADRERLKADPLVRVLIDPPESVCDFTVVSAMGVVTEGARGRELEDTYRRLQQRRGIRVVRADTATGRSLEHNALRVEEAIRATSGPWGYVGYSQGCANGLQAEAHLLSGTPEQQELVSRLRCRNLLFGAFNGSAHGTCANLKFLRGVVEGEQFLKHYQGIYSKEAVAYVQRTLRTVLDSRPFVHGTLGSHSLAHEGVRFLQREGQWKPVPTSTVRGIVEPETLPEVLDWMSNVLTRQIESAEHDTQVSAHEAVGYPVWVDNAQAELLRRCSMDSAIQRCHHWVPLLHEVEALTTARDRERAVYEGPRDRLVFPWIDVNVRFGVIGSKARVG